MTEAEWLACHNSREMLTSLRVPTHQTPLPERKSRLFGLACCERIHPLITDSRSLRALDVVAQYVEGFATKKEMSEAFEHAFDAYSELVERSDKWRTLACAAGAVADASHPDELAEDVAGQAYEAARNAGMPDEALAHVALVRDIFGNPFRPVAFSPSWRTDTVVAIARQMYDSRDFSAMPILADALQDAGCDSEDILTHCRDANQPHVRGCWVVDLVLGKE